MRQTAGTKLLLSAALLRCSTVVQIALRQAAHKKTVSHAPLRGAEPYCVKRRAKKLFLTCRFAAQSPIASSLREKNCLSRSSSGVDGDGDGGGDGDGDGDGDAHTPDPNPALRAGKTM